MTQTFLHTGEDRLVVARLDIDDAVGVKTRLRQCWRKQIRSGDDPKNLAFGAGRDTAGE